MKELNWISKAYVHSPNHFFLKLFKLNCFPDLCATNPCKYQGTCEQLSSKEYYCLCPSCETQENYSLVCASDGRTYASLCHWMKYSCQNNADIQIVHEGACGMSFCNFVLDQKNCYLQSSFYLNDFGSFICVIPEKITIQQPPVFVFLIFVKRMITHNFLLLSLFYSP